MQKISLYIDDEDYKKLKSLVGKSRNKHYPTMNALIVKSMHKEMDYLDELDKMGVSDEKEEEKEDKIKDGSTQKSAVEIFKQKQGR